MKNLLVGMLAAIVSISAYGQCDGSEPPFNFTNDTVLCQGQNLILSVPAGYDYYEWSTGQQVSTINVTQAGTYSVVAGLIGANLIQHGDFEGGTTNTANNFTTDYAPGSGGSWGLLSNPGQYAISTSPSNTHNNFVSCSDHTSGTGNMMVANGASTANTVVWSQTVNVTPNQDFIFKFWNINVVNDPNVAQLQLFINNTAVTPITPTNVAACSWSQIAGFWNSGSATQAVLKIINQSTVGGGNDFAIDDIYFAPVCIKEDSIQVTYENFTVNAGPDLTFCANETDTLVASANIPGASYAWQNGVQDSSQVPPSSGMYTITATSQNGCVAQDSALVTIKAMDWFIDTILVQPTSCGANDGYVSALTGGTTTGTVFYEWAGPGPNSPNSISASVWSNLGPGWYYLTVQNNGCYRYDSVEMTVSNPPISDLSANPITGPAPLTVDFTNNSTGGNTFFWDFGNGHTQNENSTIGQNQIYDSVGVYTVMLVSQNGSCSDTVYLQVIVTEPEVIIEPELPPFYLEPTNVFSPNGDQSNDVYTFIMNGIQSIDILISNRWGEPVFEVVGQPDFEWDGKDPTGKDCTEGVYFYTYTAKSLNGEILSGSGFLHLRR